MPKRSKARVLALQIVFQLQAQSESFKGQVDDFVKDSGLDAKSSKYAKELGLEAWEKHDELDEIINRFAKGWTTGTLPGVDLGILRLALCEMLHRTDVPGKVVIDEAVKLAKSYSTKSSSKFVNGLLDAVMKSDNVQGENTSIENNSGE